MNPKMIESINTILAQYNAHIDGEHYINRNNTQFGVKIEYKKGKFRCVGRNNNLLFTCGQVSGLGKFVEEFWLWKKM